MKRIAKRTTATKIASFQVVDHQSYLVRSMKRANLLPSFRHSQRKKRHAITTNTPLTASRITRSQRTAHKLASSMITVLEQAYAVEERVDLGRRAAHAVARAAEVDDLAQAQLVEEHRGLELHADTRLDGRGIGPHGQAVDDDLAAVGMRDALHHLEGGRLAGSVGTQDADPSPRRRRRPPAQRTLRSP